MKTSDKPDKNIKRLIIVIIVLVIIGIGIFLKIQNEGNRWLSGRSDIEWVKQTEAEDTYSKALGAIGLKFDKNSIKTQRPMYIFGPDPEFYNPMNVSWWTLQFGKITSQHNAIAIDDKSLAEWNKNLVKLGWEPHVYGIDDLKTLLDKSIALREQEIQRLQSSALTDDCINSDYCQSKHEEALLKANKEPLETYFIMRNEPFELTMTFDIYDPRIKIADARVKMTFSER